MTTDKKLLIFYVPGARGEFLAAVLFDRMQQFYNQYELATSLPYTKIHTLDVTKNPDPTVQIADIKNYKSIRIRLGKLNDFLTVLHLWNTKRPNKNADINSMASFLISHERSSRQLDAVFDYVIDFSILCSVDLVCKFYKTFHGRDIPDSEPGVIWHNINLQQQVTADNYREFFPTLDFDKFQNELNTLYG